MMICMSRRLVRKLRTRSSLEHNFSTVRLDVQSVFTFDLETHVNAESHSNSSSDTGGLILALPVADLEGPRLLRAVSRSGF